MMRNGRIIKYLIVLLLMMSAALPLGSFNRKKEPSVVYFNFGIFNFPRPEIPNTTTSFQLWITKEKLNEHENAKSFVRYKYKYKLIGMSHSVYRGNPRNTFIEGFNIYYNGNKEPLNYYPLNFYVDKNGNVLYEIKTNDETPTFYIRWDGSYYDVTK